MVVVFDAPGGTAFRREALAEYKANRVKPPPEFAVDFSNLQLLLRFLRLPTIAVPGYEADDVSASLGYDARGKGCAGVWCVCLSFQPPVPPASQLIACTC